MAWTLADMAKVETDPLRKGIIEGLLIDAVVMRQLKFDTAGTLSIKVTRMKTLPTVGWRKIGADYAESTGKTEQISESVFALGGYIDVDKMLVRAKNVLENPRTLETRMKMRAIAYDFNDKYINGDHATDPDTIEGLKKRVSLLPAAQSINAGGVTTGFDVKLSDANMQRWLDDLNKAIYAVDGHEAVGVAAYMNADAYLLFTSVARRQKLLDTTKDQADRIVQTFRGIPLYDIGVKSDQSTKIILSTEDPGDAGNDTTSIYFQRADREHLMGFEEYALEVDDIGLLDDGVTYRTVVDWPIGLAVFNNRSIVRLKGFIP